jgi:hypothetical protein
MKSMKTCPSVQVDSHLIAGTMLRQEESKEERGRSDVNASATNAEEESHSVSPALSTSNGNRDLAKVTVYRRLTFKRAEDFDSVQAGIEFSASKSDTIQAVKRELEALRRVLEEEKRDTIARTEATSQLDATAAPPQNTQKPEPADPYASLPWRPSRNDAHLSMIRVNDKLTTLGRELYQKLKASQNKALRIGNCCCKLWVTGDGAEFLQRWSKPVDAKT